MRAGWQSVKLGDVCTFARASNKGSALPYVGLEDIVSGVGRFTGSTEPKKVKSTTFKFTSEHILYGRLRPYLNKVYLPDFDGHCSTEIFPIRPGPNADRRYLYYWLSMDKTVKEIDRTSTGARMPRANMDAILRFAIALPPLSEQQRIVTILDETFAGLAAATASAEKNLKNARELFDSCLNSVFAQKGAGWVDRKLSDLVDVTHGFAFDGKYFVDDEGQHPILLTPGNFTELGSLNFNERNTKRFTGAVPPNFVLRSGDLVIVMTDLSSKMKILGKPAFLDRDDVLHNQRIGRVIFNDDTLLPEYLYYFFRTSAFISIVKDTATGTMVKHTAPKRILSALMGVPPSLSKQQGIAYALKYREREVEKLEAVYQNKLLALKKLKQSILEKAFSGGLPSTASQLTQEAAA